MAAFSYQEQPNSFLLDSAFIPTSKNMNMNVSGNFIEEGNYNFISNSNNSTCFPQFYTPPAPLDHQYYHPLLAETPHPHVLGQFDDHSSKAATFSDNEASVTVKQTSPESSAVVNSNNNSNHKLESGGGGDERVTQKPNLGKRRKNSTNLNSAQSKEEKPKKQKKCNNDGKKKEEEKKQPKRDDEKKLADQETTGYIHVRARRGQATDSHSLAERVRREKISERMKMLQGLVPGCDKVTGKALMLDEIINYVQSLQNQVEFLSMKLTSVNPLFYEFGMDLGGALMVRPESLSSRSSMPSPLPSLQQCSPIQATSFTDAATTTATAPAAATTINYPSLFLQGQDGGLMWEVDEQRQKLLIPSGFAHNLCSFH